MCASCYSKDPLRMTAYILVIVGALNWGLVGLFSLDLVHLILGFSSFLTRLVYILVGASAVLLLFGKSEHAHEASKPPAHAMPPSPPSPPRAPEPPQPMHSSMGTPPAPPQDSAPPSQPSAF
jgi:uncharacterized protein